MLCEGQRSDIALWWVGWEGLVHLGVSGGVGVHVAVIMRSLASYRFGVALGSMVELIMAVLRCSGGVSVFARLSKGICSLVWETSSLDQRDFCSAAMFFDDELCMMK